MNIKWFFGIAIPILVLFTVVRAYTDINNSKEYFSELHLKLTGIITDKQVVTSGRGLLYLDIRYSSIAEYDKRTGAGPYYCVIHNGKAELIDGVSGIEMGDSVDVDSDHLSFRVYRLGKLMLSKPLFLSQFGPLVDGARKIHRL